jgi:transaldolase
VHRLRAAVGRDNLLLKVPATPAGIEAFERLIGEGYRVNVTLMFSLAHYEAVAQAYLRGARRWLNASGDPRRPKSVASFFLSRIDSLVDPQLERLASPVAEGLRGQVAVALAKVCYQRYRTLFHGPDFADLAAAGVRPQYPLWASTGTKNPRYSEVMYVESLIGPESVATLPFATLQAFREHGRAAPSLTEGVGEAMERVQALAGLGIDLNQVGEQLQREGVHLFTEAYERLLGVLQ